jgi:importin subunit beta-1
LIVPHVQNVLDLVHRCLADEERTDAVVKTSFGLVGDLADAFPNGQIKQLLLAEWLVNELRSKSRMPPETKKTMRWAREVRAQRRSL